MVEAFIGYFLSALPAIISGVALLAVGWVIKSIGKLSKTISDFSKEHEFLMEKTRQLPTLVEDHQVLMETSKKFMEQKSEHMMLMDTSKQFIEFSSEQQALMKILMDSQRNQIKASIVEIYERAAERGYITPMELETLNRLAESYFDLGGNTYIKAVVKHANDLPIKGAEIPSE